jgi:alkyl-hydroperoxide reductase/thiol specific antioxidant family protein
VSRRRAELHSRVIVVSFAPPPRLAAYEFELRLGLPLYSDAERGLYRALGFGRASVARAWLHPKVWGRYGVLLARGRRLHRPEEDTLQLGGDAVFDADARLRWLYSSRGPEDRPSVDDLIVALSRAGAPRA